MLISLDPTPPFSLLCPYGSVHCSSSPLSLVPGLCVLASGRIWLKEQLAADVRTGNSGDIRVAGYFPLFLSMLVIRIEVVTNSIKQMYHMAWVQVLANYIPPFPLALIKLLPALHVPWFPLFLTWLVLVNSSHCCDQMLGRKQPKRGKICFDPRSRHHSWEGGMSGWSPNHDHSWRLFAHVSLVRKQREKKQHSTGFPLRFLLTLKPIA